MCWAFFRQLSQILRHALGYVVSEKGGKVSGWNWRAWQLRQVGRPGRSGKFNQRFQVIQSFAAEAMRIFARAGDRPCHKPGRRYCRVLSFRRVEYHLKSMAEQCQRITFAGNDSFWRKADYSCHLIVPGRGRLFYRCRQTGPGAARGPAR